MLTASRSKSKGKKPARDPSKSPSKPLGHVNNNAVSASGYNPLLGTFHTIEATPLSSASPSQMNGRFRNIDDTDDHNGTGIEYDTLSNNGSWSGESEDHKEKLSQPFPRQESLTGVENDKREKIRQQNEKKHQRQKEKRAQELHERCSGYLMSRKLEGLAQQLVAMGFSHERATMALIMNEGQVEASVAWLFEGTEDDNHREHNLDGGGNLKLDISAELARITDMEIKYKVSKQEVERVVVSCDGDLSVAEEMLKAQKQEPPSAPPKPEETGDPPTANDKLPMNFRQNMLRIQEIPISTANLLQKRDEKDFNYTKVPAIAASSLDPGAKNMQVSSKIPQNMEWPKPNQITVAQEKRWPLSGPSPTVSYLLPSALQTALPPANTEVSHVPVGSELRNLQLGSVRLREPLSISQGYQSINQKQASSSSIGSSPSGTAMNWYPVNVEITKSNGVVPPISFTKTLSPSAVYTNQSYVELHHQPRKQYVSGNGTMDPQVTPMGTGLWSKAGTSPTIAAASSLGLFPGPGINGSSVSVSPRVDWTTGSSTMQFDYSNIDWSLDRGLLSPRPPNRLWTARTYSIQNNADTYYGPDINSTTRPVLSNASSGESILGFQGRGASSESSAGGSREWTSPFEEKDVFSLPRHYVSFPSL